MLETISNSLMNFPIDTTIFADSEEMMYEASVIESVVIFYLESFKLTTPLLIANSYPD